MSSHSANYIVCYSVYKDNGNWEVLVNITVKNSPKNNANGVQTWRDRVPMTTSERKWGQDRSHSLSCNLVILEETTHHFCHILLSRGKLLNPVRRLHKSVNTQRWESLKANSGAAHRKQRSILSSGELIGSGGRGTFLSS